MDDAGWGLGQPRGAGAVARPGRAGVVTAYKAGDEVSVCIVHPLCPSLRTSVPQSATLRLSQGDRQDRPDPPGLEAGV